MRLRAIPKLAQSDPRSLADLDHCPSRQPLLSKPALRKLLGQALGSINSMLGQHIRQVLSQLTKYFISNLALSSPNRLSNRPM